MSLVEVLDQVERRRRKEYDDLRRWLLTARAGQGRTISPPADDGAQDDDMVPLLVNYQAAATLLGCSERTVRRLVSTGKLPVVYLGERVARIRREDVENFTAAAGLHTNDKETP